MTLEEIDERYHDAALDDAGHSWHEDAPPEAPAAPADRPGAAPPREPEASGSPGGSA